MAKNFNSQTCSPTNLRTYIPTLLVVAAITYGSLLRQPHISAPSFSNWDKLVHFGMYLLLSLVSYLDLSRDRVPYWWRVFWALILPVLFGGLIEVLQEQFFYPRTGDWMDWIADLSGAIFGYLISALLWQRMHHS